MKKFIDSNELARDSRFVRQDNAQSTVLAAMPDDVDVIVNAFEQFSPMIEESVRGTAAQSLFDAYGPAFALTVINEPIDPDAPEGLTRLLLRMHGIFVGEMQALEGAARSLWDFPDAPWEFKMNMARQCWDEGRHIQIFEKLLVHLGGYVGMFPESTFLFEAYGPGFALTILNEPIDPDVPEGLTRLLLRMHGIFVGEMQALEGAARSLWDFPDAPWEFKMNMARQCWDEGRHVQIFEKLLTHLGGEVGMFPESTFLFEAACSDDPAMRVAGVNRGLEGLAC
ncbi:MAG: hypothetical protein VCB43_01545, partial [Myxococcota bacterium]